VKQILTCLSLCILCSFSTAQEENKPFVELAKGNSWKYDVTEGKEKKKGRLTVEEVDSGGKFRLKAENLGAGFPEEMTWEISGSFLVWKIGPEFRWKILKLDASKGDTWSSKPNEKSKLSFNSKVTAVEEVTVPAGNFTCLKVKTISEGEENPPLVWMWWTKGVGLVKVETVEFGKKHTSWVLTEYTVGHGLSDEVLNEMLKKADVVAQVSIPGKEAGAKEARAKLACSFKGDPKTQDGLMVLTLKGHTGKQTSFAEGDFVVFLKKMGASFVLQHDALPAEEGLLDKLTELAAPPGETLAKFKALCDKSEIVAGIEVVKLEDRVDFKYYVAKIIGAAKGAEGREHVDVCLVPGKNPEKGGKYIIFLSRTTINGRAMFSPVGRRSEGLLDYDEGLLGKLKEICQGTGR
jgi:hypothetical protein